nr:MAG: hypothetical protein [Betatorquevirus sp.]
MTSTLKNPTLSPRQLENSWINIVFQSHDQICGCDDPWLHLLDVLNKNGNARKPLKDIENIKWLLIGKPNIGEGPSNTEEDDPGFTAGDLEKLFEEDPIQEEDEPDVTR